MLQNYLKIDAKDTFTRTQAGNGPKKKKKSLHLKVHLHLKSTSKGRPLIPMHFCYRKPVSMMCLGMEAAAGRWQREGLQPPAWCSFTFPLPELHSVISYCVAFDD